MSFACYSGSVIKKFDLPNIESFLKLCCYSSFFTLLCDWSDLIERNAGDGVRSYFNHLGKRSLVCSSTLFSISTSLPPEASFHSPPRIFSSSTLSNLPYMYCPHLISSHLTSFPPHLLPTSPPPHLTSSPPHLLPTSPPPHLTSAPPHLLPTSPPPNLTSLLRNSPPFLPPSVSSIL